MILDLRDKGGGLIPVAADLLNQFITTKDELLFYSKGAYRPKKEYKAHGRSFFTLGKIVVLINENTASAAELLAGVLAITGWILVWCAAALGAGYLMFAGIIACGGSAGLALLGASGLVGEMSPERNRAETYSALLVVAFSVLGATALLSGWVLTWAPLIDVIAACALLNIAICVPVLQGSVKLARTRSDARKTMNAIAGKHT